MLNLQPAERPSQRVAFKAQGQTIYPTSIELSGFSPRQNIMLRFYGGTGTYPQVANSQNFLLPYITTVIVKADNNGQAVYQWPGDERTRGTYGVRADDVQGELPLVPGSGQ